MTTNLTVEQKGLLFLSVRRIADSQMKADIAAQQVEHVLGLEMALRVTKRVHDLLRRVEWADDLARQIADRVLREIGEDKL